MAFNDIWKRVQLILDRASANKVESDTKKTLSNVDKSFGAIERTAKRIALALGAAFGIAFLKRFAQESIRVANEGEVIWTRLAGTIENIGIAWDTVRDKYEAASQAFQASTIHDDEAFAEGAARIIAATGDETQAIQAMGLAANVAATFFNGELGPAVEVVSQLLNGQTRTVRPLIGAYKDANEALDVLVTRTMGQAEARANTFSGAVFKLSNDWDNFKQVLGAALIEAGGGTSIIDTLRGAVQTMTRALSVNKDILREWGRFAQFAVTPFVALFDIIRAIANFIGGTFQGAAAAGIRAFGLFTKAAALGREAGAFFYGLWNKEGAAAAKAEARSLHERADELFKLARAYEAAAASKVKMAGTLATRSDVFPKFRRPAPAPGASLEDLLDLTAKPPPPGDEKDQQKKQRDRNAGLNSFLTLVQETEQQVIRLDGALRELGRGYEFGPTLKSDLKRLQEEFELTGAIAESVGEVIAGAMAGDLPRLAAAKAKQNAIMAAEQVALGFAALAGLFTGGLAGAHFANAARFSAIAAAWGALGAATGGSGGGGGGAVGGGAVGGGIARDIGGARSERAERLGVEVHMNLVGEGFDAVNPRVQDVILAGHELAKQRHGSNAKIYTYRNGRRIS